VKDAALVVAGVKSAQDILNDIIATAKQTNQEIKPWEQEVTVTDADRATGWIARGKANIKITGPIIGSQIKSIGEAAEKADDSQIFRLDFSEVTGLTEWEKSWWPLVHFELGSIALPEGLKKIEESSLDAGSSLVEANLPASLENIGTSIFDGPLARLIIPASLEQALNGSAYSEYIMSIGGIWEVPGGKSLQTPVILDEGIEEIDLGRLAVPGGYSDHKNTAIRYILPSTLKRFCVWGTEWSEHALIKLPSIVTEIYCYAATPPVYEIPVYQKQQMLADDRRNYYSRMIPAELTEKAKLCFENVKTIYVPAGSEKAYEDAWFNYTAAEFKPIPANLATIDKWY
jgi:hypothetical protein